MRSIFFILAATAIVVTGCNVQTGVAPTETVIPKTSERDFGFTGTWTPVPDAKSDAEDLGEYEMTINRDGSYLATMKVTTDGVTDSFVAEFRTHEMSPDHPHAIVELEVKDLGYRRLAIAAVKGDYLSLWTIDGRKIGKLLYDNEVAAVIEHSTFSSTVRCDPEKLLKTVADHSSDLVGSAQVFKRLPKDGR